ncbi:MAG: nucleotide exchange factor GrpE [Bacteroidales bacterium]|nr:nucleotide exchange factor GrpE [Bacteroidales bacterium]
MKKNDKTTDNDQEKNHLSETSETQENTENTDDVAQLSAQLEEERDKYLRLYSDFENFRKRVQKERSELILSASESVILSLLPILDDFDRALPAISDEATKSGVELVYSKLKSTLENKGLKTMETKGVSFDADFHEAVAQIPVNDEKEKGQIIEEIQRGYYLNDKVLRHAKVIVGN